MDILRLFENMELFNNHGGDIENLITHISFANSVRSLGNHPKMKNVLNKNDLVQGLELFKYHKKSKNESYKSMFV